MPYWHHPYIWSPYQDSNLNPKFRRLVLYPLSHRGMNLCCFLLCGFLAPNPDKHVLPPSGVEPESRAPEARALSIELWRRRIGHLMVLCAGIEPAPSGCKPDVLPLDEQSVVPKTGLEPVFPELRFRCPSLDDSGVFFAPHCATCLFRFSCVNIYGVNSGGRTHIPGLTNQRPPVRRCPPYSKFWSRRRDLNPHLPV